MTRVKRWVTRCKIESMSKVMEELFAQVRHVDLQCRTYDICETVAGKP